MVAEQRGQNPRAIGVSPESPHRTRSKGKRTPKKLSSFSCGESVAEDCRESLGSTGVRRRSGSGHVDTSGTVPAVLCSFEEVGHWDTGAGRSQVQHEELLPHRSLHQQKVHCASFLRNHPRRHGRSTGDTRYGAKKGTKDHTDAYMTGILEALRTLGRNFQGVQRS